jgi:DNA-binding MarR family transcriptional regulator
MPRKIEQRRAAIRASGRVIRASMSEMSEIEDQTLGFLVRRLMARLRPEAATALRPLGLGLPEFVCLRILETYPGRTGADLARHTHVTAQAINLVLHELEDMGAVTRPETAPSGRALPAQLTRKGKALLKQAEAAVEAAEDKILAHLSPAERRQLKRLLYRAGDRPPEDAAAYASPGAQPVENT